MMPRVEKAAQIIDKAEDFERAYLELRFLGEASAALSESLDYEETLQTVAYLAIPQFADWCAIDILDDAGILSPVAIAHRDPEMLRRADRFWGSNPRNMEDDHGMPNVIRTGRPELYTDIINDLLVPRGLAEEHIAAVCDLGFRSVVLVPLQVRGKILGGMSFVASTTGRYDAGSVRFFDLLAKRAAVAVDNARLYTLSQEEVRRRKEIEADLERRVEERTAELLAANRQLETFSYSVSHDLRAPLRSINMAAAILLEECGEAVGPDGQKELRRAITATRHMDRLIADLLEHGRLGTAPLNRGEIDFTELGRLVAQDLARDGIQITIEEDLTTSGDPVLLRVLLQNLIENAIKFSIGREGASVHVGKSAEGALYVRDNGIGFDQALASKAFEPFERIHTESQYAGTGIGLANVKRIIERHGGEIWVESAVGVGTTFFFTLAAKTSGE